MLLEAQHGNLSIAKNPQEPLSRHGREDQTAELAHKGVFLHPGRSGRICHKTEPSRHSRCRALNSLSDINREDF